MPNAGLVAAVVVIGRKAGESDSLLRVIRPISGRRTRMATAVGNPMPSTLLISASLLARSGCLRIAATRALSAALSRCSRRAISSRQSWLIAALRQLSILF